MPARACSKEGMPKRARTRPARVGCRRRRRHRVKHARVRQRGAGQVELVVQERARNCLREPTLRLGSPASSRTSARSSAACAARSPDSVARAAVSVAMPRRSIRASTRISGFSKCSYTASNVGSASSRGRSTFQRRSVASLSSCGVFSRPADRHLGEGDALAPRAGDFVERDGGVVEVAQRKVVRAAEFAAAVEDLGHKHCVLDSDDIDAEVRHDLRVILHIMADFDDARIGEQRPQNEQRGFNLDLVLDNIAVDIDMINRDIRRGVGAIARQKPTKSARSASSPVVSASKEQMPSAVARLIQTFSLSTIRSG